MCARQRPSGDWPRRPGWGARREAHKRKVALPAIQNFQSITGKGVSATVAGRPVVVASPGYLRKKNVALPPDAVSNGAETVLFVLLDGELAGYVALADRIRDDSPEAVRRLQAQGIKVYMATGDNQQVADAVAKKLGRLRRGAARSEGEDRAGPTSPGPVRGDDR